MTLSEWLAETKTPQEAFAKRVGVTQSAVAHWVTGKNLPTPDRIAQIERVTKRKVRFSDWVKVEAQ